MSREIPLVSDLSREARLALALTAAFVIFRSILATQSSFPFHQGWNEGHYALVAAGFDSHPLVPRYGDIHVYNVPPLFPYAVWVSFGLLGPSELAARLPTILAAGTMLLATYALGVQVFADRRTALTGTVVLATLPYFQLYGGRAQTDVLMTALFTTALVAIVAGYDSVRARNTSLVAGGGLFAAAFTVKQPALLLAAVVLAYLVLRRGFDRRSVRRTGILVGVSAVALLPLLAWLYLNFRLAPTAFVADWEQEVLSRTPPFANLPLLVAIAGVLGFTPLILFLAGVGGSRLEWPWNLKRSDSFAHPSLLLVWVAVVGAFVAYRTPQGHQYYAVALLPPVALLAGRGVEIMDAFLEGRRLPVGRVLVVGIVLSSTIGGTLVMYELSGEYSVLQGGGERLSADAAGYLVSSAGENPRVLVSSGFRPQIQWYTRDSISPDKIGTFKVGDLSETRLQAARANSSGPVYVVAPQPSWEDLPTESLARVYVTSPYEPTMLSKMDGPLVGGTKFGFYIADRRLVVYKVVDEE